jgi:cell division septum initiation protein DivIVA
LNQKNSQLKNELSNVTSDLEKFKNDNLVLKQKLEELQNSNNEMTKQIKEFQNKKEDNSSNFQKENISLKEKVSTLEKDITNFIKTTETFNNILGSQRGIFDKAGLGFETYKKQKLYKDFFIPPKNEEFKCKFCHKKGHIEMFCFKKKHKQEQSKNKLSKHNNKRQSHKRYQTNIQGPKTIWVPKNSVNISAGMSLNHEEKTMVPRQWMLKTHDWGQKKFSISGEERRRISHFWK